MAEFFTRQSDAIIICHKTAKKNEADSTIDSIRRDGESNKEEQIELVNQAAYQLFGVQESFHLESQIFTLVKNKSAKKV